MFPDDEEDREFDALIEIFREAQENSHGAVYVANPRRVREFIECESFLRRMFKDTGATIEVVPNDGGGSIGVIRVLTKTINIRNTAGFVRAVRLASNYEIYPRTDGKMMFALIFYGMATRVDEV